jgi:hypothetical protein
MFPRASRIAPRTAFIARHFAFFPGLENPLLSHADTHRQTPTDADKKTAKNHLTLFPARPAPNTSRLAPHL